MYLNETHITNIEKLHKEFDPLLQKYKKQIENDLFSENRDQLRDFENIYFRNYDSFENVSRLFQETSNNSHFFQNMGVKSISFEENDFIHEKLFGGEQRYQTEKDSAKFTRDYERKTEREFEEDHTVEDPVGTFFFGIKAWLSTGFVFLAISLVAVIVLGIIGHVREAYTYFSSNTTHFFYYLAYLVMGVALIVFGRRFAVDHFSDLRESVFCDGKYYKSFLAYGTWLFMILGIYWMLILVLRPIDFPMLFMKFPFGGIFSIVSTFCILGYFLKLHIIYLLLCVLCIINAVIFRKRNQS